MLLDLTGKKILVTGIANNRSIAWGIAQQLRAAGAELGITYLPDEKGRFETKVRELTAPLEPSLFLPLNVQDPVQMETVFAEIKQKQDGRRRESTGSSGRLMAVEKQGQQGHTTQ